MTSAVAVSSVKENVKHPFISWRFVKNYNCLKWPKTFAHTHTHTHTDR